MPPQPHLLRRLTFDVAAADLDTALALRARAEDIARVLIPPVLERVFDALAPAERHIRLERLDLNLGTITAERLEAEVPDALERALTRALGEAIAGARGESVSTGQARLGRFETYLLTGMVAFYSENSPVEQLADLIAEDPAAIREMLRRIADDRRALERLVLNAGEANLTALLGILAPADAAVIRRYITDLILLRQGAPDAEPRAPVPRRVWWVLTLEYLLHDAGSQFNRRSFVVFLLQGVARVEGIAYDPLLMLLREALDRTRARQALGTSLPVVLDELFARLPPRPIPSEGDTEAGIFTRAEAGNIAPLLELLRAALGDPAAMEALAARLTGGLFAVLLQHLDAANAALILSYVGDLTALHRERPLVTLSDAGFASLTRSLVLQYALREPESPFNSRSWLRRLLRGIAAARGIAYAALLRALSDALERLRDRLPVAASLPAVVGVLAAEQAAEESAPAGDPGPFALAAVGELAPLLALLRRCVGEPAALEAVVARLSGSMFSEVVRRFDPANAMLILAYAGDLRTAHREAPVLALPAEGFERLVRRLTLQYLLLEAGSAFNRRSWLRRLLRDMAAAEDVPYAALLSSLAGALDRMRQRLPASSSLPAAVEALLDELTPPRPAAEPADRERLLAWLAGAGGILPEKLVRLLVELAEAGDAGLDSVLRAGLARREIRERWAASLPDAALGWVLRRIAPSRATAVLHAMTILAGAWRQVAPAARRSAAAGLPWAQLLGLLADPGTGDTQALVRRLSDGLAGGNADAAERLRARAEVMARAGGHAALAANLRAAAPQRNPARPDTVAAIYIGNAGLVLFNPFLPMFFERLGLLRGPAGRIAGLEASSRAVHLLQYLVEQRCDRPEPLLVLNKLLCGVLPAEPILPAIKPSEAELDVCAQVTQAVIGNWTAIRNAAPDAVRETFLQREGRLTRGVELWNLQVQRKTVDVLTDLIPWSLSVVYHRWMAEPIHVTW